MIKKWLLLLVTVLLVSCSPEQTKIEDIQYLQALGHDLYDGKLETTGITTVIMPMDEVIPESESLVTEYEHLEALYSGFQSESSRIVDTSRTSLQLFNDEVAQAGVFQIADNTQRNPMIEQDMHLAVTEGSTRDILEFNYPFHTTPEKYLVDLIERNEEIQLPKSNLHEFLYRYYAEGAEPFLPFIEKQGDRVEVVGLALFKGDEHKQTLSMDQTKYFRQLFEKTAGGNLSVPFNNDRKVTLIDLETKPDLKIEPVGDHDFHVTINVVIYASLRETTNVDANEYENVQQIERLTEELAETEMNSIVSFLQDENIDAIGIGEIASYHIRGLDIQQWETDHFQEADIHVNVDVSLEDTGAVM
ncbi:Ger(x)C family spore germination protein [Geomicrobium sp. JSM 1781026]|uniref:Ger(x)C family spore germination protein n=1 Tax=Geomicrobium sp. JSM 1781026 TaxID=3344580 RepID=UPI0035BFBCB3